MFSRCEVAHSASTKELASPPKKGTSNRSRPSAGWMSATLLISGVLHQLPSRYAWKVKSAMRAMSPTNIIHDSQDDQENMRCNI